MCMAKQCFFRRLIIRSFKALSRLSFKKRATREGNVTIFRLVYSMAYSSSYLPLFAM